MREADFEVLLQLVERLSDEQRTALGRALASASGEPEAVRLFEGAFAAAPRCPHCGAERLQRWGFASGLRRYRCQACRKTFNALTGTSLARLRKKACWLRHGDALAAGTGLAKAAPRLRGSSSSLRHQSSVACRPTTPQRRRTARGPDRLSGRTPVARAAVGACGDIAYIPPACPGRPWWDVPEGRGALCMAQQTLTLKAERRDHFGKGPARALRRAGKVPAIVNGGREESLPIALPFKEVKLAIGTNPRFFTSVLDLDFGDGTIRVLPREAQLHPVTDDPLHVDFLRATQGATLTLAVPVRFVHEDRCPGLRRGGVLNIVRREVELVCPADSIPGELVADLAGLDIGDSLHISQVKLPEGVRPTITDRDFTIASVVPPSTDAEAATPGTEAAQGS